MRIRKSARTTEAEEPLSLNSLLDTLMNVVGISLILLAAADLTLIRTKQQLVSTGIPSDIAKRLETEKARRREEPAPPQRSDKEENAGPDQDKDRNELLARLKAQADEASNFRKSLASLGEAQRSHRQLQDELAAIIVKNQALGTEIDRISAERAIAPRATTIQLPWKRTINKQLQPVTFVCRNDRVYRLDFGQVSKAFAEAWKTGMSRITQSMSNPQRIRTMMSYFDAADVGDRYFRLKLEAVGEDSKVRGFLISTLPRARDQGETLRESVNPNSEFMTALRQINPDTHCIRFSVWSDSFPLYLAVRQEVERLFSTQDSRGTRIGLSWIPYATDEELTEFMDLTSSSNKGSTAKGGTTIDN